MIRMNTQHDAGWFTAFFGLRRTESAYIVVRMSLLFAMDSFAGAFVQQVVNLALE